MRFIPKHCRPILAIGLVFVLVGSTRLHADSTLLDWDFDTSRPTYGYTLSFAGQGSSDCQTDIANIRDVESEYQFADNVAFSQFDTSGWNVASDACWSYAGWQFGLGHDLEMHQQTLASDDLSEYRLSFDAWVQGTQDLPAIVQVHLNDNSESNILGNPTTRVVIGNNRELDDGDRNPLMLTNTRRTYSMTLDQLGFSDLNNNGVLSYTQDDLSRYFADITSLNIEIEPRGTSGVVPGEMEQIGIDKDNMVYLDNVRLQAPIVEREPVPSTSVLMSWDFESQLPDFSYAFAFAGQGSADCGANINNRSQVSMQHRIAGTGAASATLDTSGWSVAEDACWSFAGWEFGLGHNMQFRQQFASSDLSQYTVNFDAWIDGAAEMPAILQLHLQDASDRDASGVPATRVVLGNNREVDDGDQNPLMIGGSRRSFSVSLADLGFADLNGDGMDDYSAEDFASFFSRITSFNLEIEPQGTSGVLAKEPMHQIGIDANNILRIDNVSLNAPIRVLCSDNSGGDLDGNGVVDFSDFLVVSANFGQMVVGHQNGDVDCDGAVGFSDFLIISDNFGKASNASFAVPEPSGFAFGLFALLGCGLARRLFQRARPIVLE